MFYLDLFVFIPSFVPLGIVLQCYSVTVLQCTAGLFCNCIERQITRRNRHVLRGGMKRGSQIGEKILIEDQGHGSREQNNRCALHSCTTCRATLNCGIKFGHNLQHFGSLYCYCTDSNGSKTSKCDLVTGEMSLHNL
jgi:hypothetical protein